MAPPKKKYKSGACKKKTKMRKEAVQLQIKENATKFWTHYANLNPSASVPIAIEGGPEGGNNNNTAAESDLSRKMTEEVNVTDIGLKEDTLEQNTNIVLSCEEESSSSDVSEDSKDSDVNNDYQNQNKDDDDSDDTNASSTKMNFEEMDIQIEQPSYQSTDPGLWPYETDRNLLQEYWCEKGSNSCRNLEDNTDFSASRNVDSSGTSRTFTKSLMYRVMKNGEKVQREFILYSPSNGSIYCFYCRLFCKNYNYALSTQRGYNDWRHVSQRLAEHESSQEHQQCIKNYLRRCHTKGRIDYHHEEEIRSERKYWCDVLQRVVAVIKFLCERGLPFRGSAERFGSKTNGNYLGLLELLAQFDPFLSKHLEKYGNKGSGTHSYLSKQICEEFIGIMGKQVQDIIVGQIKSAKYFSISVDSTPDVSHVDQLTITIRYVDKLKGGPVERFLKFVPIHGHTGQSLANVIIETLEEYHLDIQDCRGQSYDNASNMSGKYKGVKAFILSENPLADYVPCAAHSLNLVGQCAVKASLVAVKFFGVVHTLYNFFSSSTHRWELLLKYLSPNDKGRVLVVKRLGDTRWSSHADAIKALHTNYKDIMECLKIIAENLEENPETRHTAQSTLNKMMELENIILCIVWNKILGEINKVNIALQSQSIVLGTAVNLLEGLEQCVQNLRNDFESIENAAKEIFPDSIYKFERTRRRKTFFDEDVGGGDMLLEGSKKFEVETFYVIIDTLVICLRERKEKYAILNERFGFLDRLLKIVPEDLKISAKRLQEIYRNDLEISFVDEVQRFQILLLTSESEPDVNLLDSASTCLEKMKNWSQSKKNLKDRPIINCSYCFKFLREQNIVSVFPNVDIALRIYLTLHVSVAQGERTFSKLKLIKSNLRSTMTEDRLNSLAIMSMESDIVDVLDFDEIIKQFSDQKCRKVSF